MLIGRDPEQRLIDGLIEEARTGTSAALLIRGEAGIGKTAVLERAAQRAAMRTLRCTGVEAEHDLPFAGLEQLLRPVRALADRLPDPQAGALSGAFGLTSDRVQDRLLLGLATLGLLAEATGDAPLLCLIDDLQWLDVPSAQALLFAARRLGAEGVVMLFAVRDDPADWYEAPGVQQLTLAPLSESAARQIVVRRPGVPLSHAVQQRLLREAGGNPLALLELPAQELSAGEATGVEAAFRARVMRLPFQTRGLLLLAAAGHGDEARTWAELGRLGDFAPMTQRAAVDAGLIGDVDAIVFRHPLVRSAVYNTSSPAERAEAHLRLATGASDSLARASHRAAATAQPDEASAMELEQVAEEAARRGGFASAAAAFARAAELSTDNEGRVRRLIAAAQAYLDAGDSDASSEFAEAALAGAGTASDQAALAAVRGALELQRGTPGAAYELLVAAAHGVARDDPAHALDLQAQAITASFVAGWPERAFVDAHALVKDLPATGKAYEQFLRVFLAAMAATDVTARRAAREQLLEDIRTGAAASDFRFMGWAGIASAYLGDLRSARVHSMRALASARAAGSFSRLPVALLGPTRLAVAYRAFDEAEEFAREGLELTSQLGQENIETIFSGALVRCLAARGEVDKCRELGEATLSRALARGIATAATDVHLGLAELELSLGHGAAARDMIESVSQPLFRLGAASDLVEALLLTGDPEPARASLDALADYAEQAHDPHTLGILARARAFLAPSGDVAEPLFLEALGHQTEHLQPFERARTALAYGEFLRRAQRRTEARVQLREALATFEGLSSGLWAERARAELEATGITARRRDPSTLDTLTPQELRIAKLVAGGASNRDVAAQLFLSQKTVEYHLRKVFLKLGVSSRVELAHRPLQVVAAGAAG
jgi:DNA-binding CsgD family transcriptional regulator